MRNLTTQVRFFEPTDNLEGLPTERIQMPREIQANGAAAPFESIDHAVESAWQHWNGKPASWVPKCLPDDYP